MKQTEIINWTENNVYFKINVLQEIWEDIASINSLLVYAVVFFKRYTQKVRIILRSQICDY